MNVPWMKDDEISLIEKYISKDSLFLEYGSGYSTKWLSDRVHKIVSVEHHREWHEKVKNTLKDSTNIEYLLIEPSVSWDDRHDGTLNEFFDYVHSPLSLVDHLDFALVDGRARVACCNAIIQKFSDSVIFFHDFTNRAFDGVHDYGNVLDFLEIIDQSSTLVALRKK